MAQELHERSETGAYEPELDRAEGDSEVSEKGDWFRGEQHSATELAAEDRDEDDGIVVARHRSLWRRLGLILAPMLVCGGVGWLVWVGYGIHLDTQAKLLRSVQATEAALKASQAELSRLRSVLDTQAETLAKMRQLQAEQAGALAELKGLPGAGGPPADRAKR